MDGMDEALELRDLAVSSERPSQKTVGLPMKVLVTTVLLAALLTAGCSPPTAKSAKSAKPTEPTAPAAYQLGQSVDYTGLKVTLLALSRGPKTPDTGEETAMLKVRYENGRPESVDISAAAWFLASGDGRRYTQNTTWTDDIPGGSLSEASIMPTKTYLGYVLILVPSTAKITEATYAPGNSPKQTTWQVAYP